MSPSHQLLPRNNRNHNHGKIKRSISFVLFSAFEFRRWVCSQLFCNFVLKTYVLSFGVPLHLVCFTYHERRRGEGQKASTRAALPGRPPICQACSDKACRAAVWVLQSKRGCLCSEAAAPRGSGLLHCQPAGLSGTVCWWHRGQHQSGTIRGAISNQVSCLW